MHKRLGFTLVELLVVIAIIGTLVGLLLPSVQQAREAARRMQCGNNLKQLALALHNYENTDGRLPPNGNSHAGWRHGWNYRILSFIEQNALFEQYDINGEWFDADNQDVYSQPVATYWVESPRDMPVRSSVAWVAKPRRLVGCGADSSQRSRCYWSER